MSSLIVHDRLVDLLNLALTRFHCNRCKRKIKSFSADYDEAKSIVKISIECHKWSIVELHVETIINAGDSFAILVVDPIPELDN